MITVTPAADAQISAVCKENSCYAITLNLKGGGCAGFEYDWGTAQAEDLGVTDFLVECDGGRLSVNASSILFLAGTEVDYVRSIVGANFQINNPNAQSSCGCGVSVNFDMDKLAIPAI